MFRAVGNTPMLLIEQRTIELPEYHAGTSCRFYFCLMLSDAKYQFPPERIGIKEDKSTSLSGYIAMDM